MGNKKIKPSQKLPDHPKPVNPLHQPVSVSFRYIAAGAEHCLSKCIEDDVREVMDCLRQLTTLTWMQVLQTAGKGENKAGLAYTPYGDDSLKGVSRPQNLSPEIRIAGIRASQRVRVFGAYRDHVFYLLWFDKDHSIVPYRHKN
jgi:hypothetical protein